MIVLSNRGYPMLKTFFDMHPDEFMSQEEAKLWDQRPFRSMLVRKYVTFHRGRGFRITKEGRQALRIFIATDISRKDTSKPLTKYFNPEAYRLKIVEKSA